MEKCILKKEKKGNSYLASHQKIRRLRIKWGNTLMEWNVLKT